MWPDLESFSSRVEITLGKVGLQSLLALYPSRTLSSRMYELL